MPRREIVEIPEGYTASTLNFQKLDDVEAYWYEMQAYCLDYAVFEEEYSNTLDASCKQFMEVCNTLYEHAKQDFLIAFKEKYGRV